MPIYEFRLFADYFQVYLQDEQADGDLSRSWTDEACSRLLALAPGTIAVGTARNMTVPVIVEIAGGPPQEEDWSAWDQVNECSIDLPSGRLVIAGCTDYFPDAARIQVEPGSYRARIYYAELDSLRENGLQGDDHYRIVLWPAESGELVVLKQREERTR